MKKLVLISLTSILFTDAFGQTNIFPASGNVGIGTTSPAYPLTITGGGSVLGVDNGSIFSAKNASGSYEQFLWPRWFDNIMYLNYGSGGFNIRNNSSVTTMFMTNSGNVGIGTGSPVSMLDIKSGIDIDNSGTSFIAPYLIGGTNDVGAGQPLQYILLCPLISSGSGIPSAGLSGIISMYRGTQGSYNVSAEYRVLIQAAYSSNNVSVVPLSESSPLLNVYDVIYNGQDYAALKITEVAGATYRVSFRGEWWNNINSTKPQIVLATALTSVNVYKNYASVLGGSLYSNSNGNVLIGKTSQTNTSYKLDVNGNIRANQVTVNATGADYVFDPTYHIRSIDSLNNYIQAYHHLPGIPSANQMQEKGNNISATQMKMLQNEEEMALYIINVNKKVQELEKQIKRLNTQVRKLKSKHP